MCQTKALINYTTPVFYLEVMILHTTWLISDRGQCLQTMFRHANTSEETVRNKRPTSSSPCLLSLAVVRLMAPQHKQVFTLFNIFQGSASSHLCQQFTQAIHSLTAANAERASASDLGLLSVKWIPGLKLCNVNSALPALKSQECGLGLFPIGCEHHLNTKWSSLGTNTLWWKSSFNLVNMSMWCC